MRQMPCEVVIRRAWWWVIGSSVMVFGATAPTAHAQAPDGEQTYKTVCANCHGEDGKGGPGTATYNIALPDFTDCSFNSREPDADFFAVAMKGGPVRGFSPIMPAHEGSIGEEGVRAALAYIRTLCSDASWPRGELNLPRPLVTEKAYPEDEAVLTTMIAAEGSGAVINELLYERRFGARNQIEVKVPFGVREDALNTGDWTAGVGDVALGFKRAMVHSLAAGSILSLGGEIVLPTGDEDDGFGKGTVVFEPFVSYGQILPANAFLHVQALAEFPADGARADPEGQLRSVIGWSWSQGRFGRTWSPMLEVLTTAEFGDVETEWRVDLVPQVQVTLNTRQHVMLNVGVRVPIDDSSRATQLMVYLLWDWFDGGLFDGW